MGGRAGIARCGRRVVVGLQAQRHNEELLPIEPEILRHEVGVVAAEGDEPVDLAGQAANLGQGLPTLGLVSSSRSRSSPCSVTSTGTCKCRLSSGTQPAMRMLLRLTRSGRLCVEPLDQAKNFFPLVTVFAFEHRDREFAEFLGLDLDPARGQTLEDPGTIEPVVQRAGEPAEQRNLLLQVDVDAAEEHLVDADVLSSVRIGV